MGKNRDLFKKIGDTKGTFHAKMGTIKDRNSMVLTETEDVKKWQEYTEEICKRDLHVLENHDGVITHLKPDILECKATWALGHQQIWKTQQWPQDWKRPVFIPNPKERQCQRMFKLPQIALISHTSKVMLKILQARLQQCVNHELQDVQAGFRKGRGTRDQIANIQWIIKKIREFQKNAYFCFLYYNKAFD